MKHIAFANKAGDLVCSDCGTKFHCEGKGKTIRCPHCGMKLNIELTRKSVRKSKYSFSTLDTIDIILWCDMVQTLKRLGKDVKNAYYVCPSNIIAQHDYWQSRLNKMILEKRKREEYERAKKDEADFIRLKSKFFDLKISDGTIEISVLDSIDAFKEESDRMHHCVYSCHYYNHADSLIMSARIDGQRIETIEWSLSQNKILQSRAVCNGVSEYHDRIIALVNAYANEIAKRQTLY